MNGNIIHTKEHYMAMKTVKKTQRLMIAYRFKIFFLLMFQVFFNEHIQAKNKHKNSKKSIVKQTKDQKMNFGPSFNFNDICFCL